MLDMIKRWPFLRRNRSDRQEDVLVRRLVAHDQAAVDDFVRTYAPRLYSAFLGMCDGNASDAQDITFRSLETGYAKMATFRGTSSLFSWLYRIGHRFRLMERRPKARASEDLMSELPKDIPATNPSSADVVSAQDEVAALERAIATLPCKMREAISLRFYGDMSVPQIAECLGVREGTVKSRLHYAMDRLRRQMLGRNGGNGLAPSMNGSDKSRIILDEAECHE